MIYAQFLNRERGGNGSFGAAPEPESEYTYTLYVTQSGDDSNSGSVDSPLYTLEGARNRLRVLTGRTANGTSTITGPWTGAKVIFGAGKYSFVNGDLSAYPVVFDERDSGNESGRIVYEAATGESVVFTGAYQVEDESWREVVASGAGAGEVNDSTAYNKLPVASRGNTYRLDVGGLGINKGTWDWGYTAPVANDQLRLISGDSIMRLSRFPNGGDQSAAGWAPIVNHSVTPGVSQYADIAGTTAAGWSVTGDARIYGAWSTAYALPWWGIGSLASVGGNTRITSGNTGIQFKSVNLGGFLALLNFLEGLSSTGSYVWNHSTGHLYFRPPGDTAPTNTSLLLATSIIDMGVSGSSADAPSWITFKGITFEGTRNGCVRHYRSNRIRFEGCEFRNFGGLAGAMYSEDASNLEIIDGSIHHGAHGGVQLHGGDRATLTQAGILIDGTEVYDIGFEPQQFIWPALQFIKEGGGDTVARHACGVTIRNVTMTDCRDSGVSLSGPYCVMEDCVFDNVCSIVGDAGVTGGGFTFSTVGTAIRRCSFYNIRRLGNDEGFGNQYQHQSTGKLTCIYLDLVWGFTVEDCYFENVDSAMLIGAGKNHVIRRNKMVNAGFDHFGAADVLLSTRSTHTGVPLAVLTTDLALLPLGSAPWTSVAPTAIDYRTGGSRRSVVLYHEGLTFVDNMSTKASGIMAYMAWSDVSPQTVDGFSVGVDWDQLQYALGSSGTPTDGGGDTPLEDISDTF